MIVVGDYIIRVKPIKLKKRERKQFCFCFWGVILRVSTSRVFGQKTNKCMQKLSSEVV